ncbi:MAG: ATP-binding cassette domain-containing protein [Acidobacteria bacterium]|nr:ATP-binding cassette domain-containing protein [Acidobacteriota bacterium]
MSLTIENLGKRYYLERSSEDGGGIRATLRAFRDRLLRRAAPAEDAREFWALRNLTLSVDPGTILGIIGPNGAGKTTLLKILARVTLPTEGRASGSGRVVSLLELGAGFDADLAARDNVIMNAAMNGISRSEALDRLPGILEFAEIERFSDAPLKHYSSGMYLRLAFSVAINMDPRILLADEILAVGDLAFQERCLQKVEESGRNGLTVLFVSHDMEAIMRVCTKVLWLDKGQVQKIGDPEEVVGEYQESVWSELDPARSERGRQSSRFAAIRGVKLLNADGSEIGAAPLEQDVFVAIGFEAFKTVSVKGAIDLNAHRQLVFRSQDEDFRELPHPGLYELRVRIPAHLLSDITYQVSASLTTLREGQGRHYRLNAYDALSFLAYRQNQGVEATKRRPAKTGLLAPRFDWDVKEVTPVGA